MTSPAFLPTYTFECSHSSDIIEIIDRSDSSDNSDSNDSNEAEEIVWWQKILQQYLFGGKKILWWKINLVKKSTCE